MHQQTYATVLPIYTNRPNGVPCVAGSGFMLRIQDATFLITAAHTAAVHPDAALYVRGEKPLSLRGTFTFTSAQTPVDIALTRLDCGFADLERRYRPVTVNDVDVYDEIRENCVYSFMGYPSSATKPNLKEKSIDPKVHTYTSHMPLKAADYARFDINPAGGFGMFFDIEKARNARTAAIVRPKAPAGISGGPVWRLGNFEELSSGTIVPKIVGVCVEYRRVDRLMLASRIAIPLEIIRNRFPDVATDVPRNRRHLVNITRLP